MVRLTARTLVTLALLALACGPESQPTDLLPVPTPTTTNTPTETPTIPPHRHPWVSIEG